MINQFKKNTLGIAIGLILSSGYVYSAETDVEIDPETDVEVISVTSSKAGFLKAQDIKRDASSIIDGITASELGVFPDANVADSLSHITGVTISRTSGGEGQSVSIRGLGPEFSIVTINERILATDATGREFAFDVLPAEVISEAFVFKSVTASQLEGSIGGAVNLVTARPFNKKGTHGSASFTGQYGEQADKYGYKITGVGSHTFANDTMGVLFSVLYSRTPTRTDELSDNNFGSGSSDNFVRDINGDGLTNDPADRELLFPGTIAYRATEENKERTAISGAFQYRPSDDLDVVVDALYTRLNTPKTGFTASYFFPDSNNFRDLEFSGPRTELNPQGILLSGVTVDNLRPQLVTAEEFRVVDTFNVGINAIYNLTQNSTLKGDLYLSTATRDAGGRDRFVVAVPNPDVVGSTTARVTLSPRDLPSIDFTFNDNAAGISEVSDLVGNDQFGPHFTRLEGVDVDDEVIGASLKYEVFFDLPVLTSTEFGVVYNKRTKERTQFDNADTMTLFSNAPFSFADVGVDVVQSFPFDNFLDNVGGVFPREFAVFDVEQAFVGIRASENDPDIINPLTGLPFVEGFSDALFPTFNPDLSGTVEEETISTYVQGNFGVDFKGMSLTGNVGLRYIRTETTSSGFDSPIEFIDQSPTNVFARIVVNGETTPISVKNDYDKLLPSVNLQLGVTDELSVRFAYAEVISRPEIDKLSTQVDTTAPTFGLFSITELGNPDLDPVTATQADISIEWYYKEGSSVTAAVFYKDIDGFVQDGQDAFLNDRENAPVISVLNPNPTVDSGREDVVFSVLRPENLDKAEVLGFEFSFQHFFESGFGITGNYTYIDTEATSDGFKIGVLEGVPDTSYTLNLLYNNSFMSLNLSASHTEAFITSHFSSLNTPNAEGGIDSIFKGTADPLTFATASATFYLGDGLETFVQVDNLLDEGFQGFDGSTSLTGSYVEWGRQFNLGVRYKF